MTFEENAEKPSIHSGGGENVQRSRCIVVDETGYPTFRRPTGLLYSPPIQLDPLNPFDTWLADRLAQEAASLEEQILDEQYFFAQLASEEGSETTFQSHVDWKAFPGKNRERGRGSWFRRTVAESIEFLRRFFTRVK